jgi:Leucine-rich repeat (LRR) protein
MSCWKNHRHWAWVHWAWLTLVLLGGMAWCAEEPESLPLPPSHRAGVKEEKGPLSPPLLLAGVKKGEAKKSELPRADEPESLPLPSEVVRAWEKAGAQVGWMGQDQFGRLVFQATKVGLRAPVPAFRFGRWVEGVVSRLPAPGRAFGLALGNTRITDAGLKELAGLKNLRWLVLRDTQITDAGLKELAGLQNLQRLDLGFTRITDAGLKELAGLKNLQWLNLWGTRITDAGLKELAGLKNLLWLGLEFTQITDAGVRELQKALPKCLILWK